MINQKRKRPPFLANILLKILLKHEEYHEFTDDIGEVYKSLIDDGALLKAKRWYWFRVIESLPSVITEKIQRKTGMFKSYVKIALRNMKKHKGFSFINIAGLALGMACFIVLLLYIRYELSFDGFHEKADRIFRLRVKATISGRFFVSSSTNAQSAPLLKETFPEIINSVRLWFMSNPSVQYEDKKFQETNVWYADDSILDVFSFTMVNGDPKTALLNPYSLVITEEMAQKYFGDENPIGKMLMFNNSDNFAVRGVIENIPQNSTLSINMLSSMKTLYAQMPPDHPFLYNWTSNTFLTYVLLEEGVDYGDVVKKLPDFVETYGGDAYREIGAVYDYFLQPLKDIYLRTPPNSDGSGTVVITYVYIFLLIALFILFLACINFMNLSTARSAIRAREVGLKKVFGAVKGRLIGQFLSESIIYSFIAVLFAFVIAQLVLPYVGSLVNRNLQITLSDIKILIPGLIGLAVIVGILAGTYPAFFLSAFQPVKVLTGKLKSGAGNSRFRSILVILQFSISITLIIGTSIVMSQLNYMRNKDPGFNKEQILVLPIRSDEMRASLNNLKEEFKMYLGVVSVAASSALPGWFVQQNGKYPEGMPPDKEFIMSDITVDEDFIPTLGMEIVAGRNFSKQFITDHTEAVIINEVAVKQIGWNDPIGKKMKVYWSRDPNIKKDMTVIGVIKDYHQLPMANGIQPLYIGNDPQHSYNPLQRVLIKIRLQDITGTIEFINKKWDELYPEEPFNYSFLDASFDNQFNRIGQLREIFSYFAILAIIIACLGLFGLASFIAEQRTKEIGIRKALGATVPEIILMLSKEFTKWIVLANIIAWPVAYFFMNKWLESFAERINLGPNVFLISSLSALLIALITVSYQAVRAATVNPVESLRYE